MAVEERVDEKVGVPVFVNVIVPVEVRDEENVGVAVFDKVRVTLPETVRVFVGERDFVVLKDLEKV